MFRIALFSVILWVCAIQLNAQIIDTVCPGSKNLLYHVDFHQGSVYYWNISGGVIQWGNGTNEINVNWGTSPGTYSLNVTETNATGCPGNPMAAFILIRGNMHSTLYPPNVCINDSASIVARGGLHYVWSTGNTDSSLRIKITGDTTLLVMITDSLCPNRTDTLSVAIKGISKPLATFSSDAKEVYLNQSVNFVYAGNAHDNIVWQIQKANASSRTSHGVNAQFIDTGEASVKLITVNKFGCIDSSENSILVKYEQLFLPNAFTPNGDGLNDVFKPGYIGINSYHLQIFNRWGELLFETNNLDQGWDGKFKGDPVQIDSYQYLCSAKGESGQPYYYNGSVAVLR